jgi:hypothetical protein
MEERTTSGSSTYHISINSRRPIIAVGTVDTLDTRRRDLLEIVDRTEARSEQPVNIAPAATTSTDHSNNARILRTIGSLDEEGQEIEKHYWIDNLCISKESIVQRKCGESFLNNSILSPSRHYKLLKSFNGKN